MTVLHNFRQDCSGLGLFPLLYRIWYFLCSLKIVRSRAEIARKSGQMQVALKMQYHKHIYHTHT